MLAIQARRVMRASPDRIFAHIGRIEHLSRYGAPLWMTAEVADTRRNAHVVTFTGYLVGLPVESVQRIVLHPPTALEFRQVRGTLRAFSGQCSLSSVEDGTEVRFRLEVDPGIPMISDAAARQFLVQFVERFLDRIKLAAERKPPAYRQGHEAARKSGAVEPAGVEPASLEVEDESELAEQAVPAAPPLGDAAAGGPGLPPSVASGPEPDPAPGARAEQPRPSGRRRRRRRRRRQGGGTPPAPSPSP